ncbi:uncharacterized protein [Chelonus insularis]|uniref:uncharacterized protein n=1 Tax=Chelonus insularis TaxID=460826 RepID=UPI00158D4B62|nr:uncharacterized protein LOC118066998 [Chelonus insularis]
MSCFYPAWLQICTYILEPHEIALLQHPVFREYAKIVFSPDFSHTFPTFIFVLAIYIALQRNLNLSWIKTLFNMKFFSKFIRILVIWNIINAALWYWLIMQRVLYCVIWTSWRNESELPEVHYPWWKKVFASFDPPPEEPILSASFVSWIISMTISGVFFYFAIYMDYIIRIVQQFFEALKTYFKAARKWQKSSLKNIKELKSCKNKRDTSTDRLRLATSCNDLGSNTSVDCAVPQVVNRGISPISYGTNWILPPNGKLKNEKKNDEFKVSKRNFLRPNDTTSCFD